MSHCMICEKIIPAEDHDICETCKEFLKWKHDNGLTEELEHFRKLKKYIKEWRSGKK